MQPRRFDVGDVVEITFPEIGKLLVRVHDVAPIDALPVVECMDPAIVREVYESLDAVQAMLCVYPAIKPPQYVIFAVQTAAGEIVCDGSVLPLPIGAQISLERKLGALCRH